MDKFKTALSLLPAELRDILDCSGYCMAEEIRMRVGKSPAVFLQGCEEFIREKVITPQELALTVEKACGASLQAHLHEIKNGFIGYKGLRIGVCGTAVYTDEKLYSIHSFNSVNIRIPHELCGDISQLLYKLRLYNYESALIISPPGYGKTSLLRALIKNLSSKDRRISVVDERNELACVENGKNYFDLGEHTDIITGIKKAEGVMMLLRGMSPDLIALDEISKKDDIAAIYELAGCGVDILATAHGKNLNSLAQRPVYRELISEKIFKNIITIKRTGNTREYLFQRIEH